VGFGETLIAALSLLLMFGWPMVWIVAHYAYEGWKVSQEIVLKREMAARGYTAQEIVQVVAARKGSQPKPTTDVPPAKPVKEVPFPAH
jgi:hypothetical protein